jgi:hypothetical protein
LKLGEEYQEALSAYLLGETDERFAEELTDVALVSIGMLSLLSVNFDDVAEGKMQQTWEKYNPTEVQFLMMQGLTREEALHTLKHRWNRSHGNSHIPNP